MNLTLEQVIKFARATDLKNFAVINNYDELIQILNLVLIELHARFTLKQDIMTIPLSADKTTYKLTDYLKEEEVTKAEMDTIIESVNAALTQKINELTDFVNTSVTTLSNTVELYLQKIDHIPDNLTESLTTLTADVATIKDDIAKLKTDVAANTTLVSSKIGYKTYSNATEYYIGDLILEAGAVYLVTAQFTATGTFADDAANYKAL